MVSHNPGKVKGSHGYKVRTVRDVAAEQEPPSQGVKISISMSW